MGSNRASQEGALQMKKEETKVCIVDFITGTVLGVDGLYYCEASNGRIEKACNQDESARSLASRKKGSLHISVDLMDALLHKDVVRIGELLHWDVEVDNGGQIVLYTGVKDRS